MKKIVGGLFLMLLMVLLVACKKEQKEPDTLTLSLTGLKGEGTLKNPYVVVSNQGETIIKKITLSETWELEFIFGSISKNQFKTSKSESAEVSIPEQDPNYLYIKTNQDAKDYAIRVKGKGLSSSIYIEVTVTKVSLTNRLRVLSIGNSFSEDAMEYLYQIAKSSGIEDVVIGYLYRGGSSLEYHWDTYQNQTSYERFMINDNGTWRRDAAAQSKTALIKYEWDIVTLQQASGYSGIQGSFDPYIANLIAAIREHKLSKTTFVWHSTWAYSKTSSHSDFPKYDKDQDKMFNAIIDAAKVKINENDEFRAIIPAGTAVQNLRVFGLSESLVTRDGYHLNERLGRYTAALMWYRKLTGLSLDLVTYVPESETGTVLITEENLVIVKNAVEAAYQNPFFTVSK